MTLKSPIPLLVYCIEYKNVHLQTTLHAVLVSNGQKASVMKESSRASNMWITPLFLFALCVWSCSSYAASMLKDATRDSNGAS